MRSVAPHLVIQLGDDIGQEILMSLVRAVACKVTFMFRSVSAICHPPTENKTIEVVFGFYRIPPVCCQPRPEPSTPR